MKVTEIIVEIKEGLPNYSGRTATVKVVANADECLNIPSVIAGIRAEILIGFAAKSGNIAYERNASLKTDEVKSSPAAIKAMTDETPILKKLKAKDLISDEDLEG